MLTKHPSGDGAGYGPQSRRSLYAALRDAIGDALRKQYEPSAPFPQRLRALLRRLDETDTERGEDRRDP